MSDNGRARTRTERIFEADRCLDRSERISSSEQHAACHTVEEPSRGFSPWRHLIVCRVSTAGS
jgi:hypothetical protein